MEFVFVVPRAALFPERYPHGLVRFAAGPRAASEADVAQRDPSNQRSSSGRTPAPLDLERLDLGAFEATVAGEGFFVERAHAERTPLLKQIIPYSIVACGDRVLLTKRKKSGGESRLHEKYSIGIGGHINPVDADDARSVIDSGTRREIDEELAVRGEYKIRRIGLINDDSNAVGAVHVGVVQVIHTDAPVEIREREQLEGRLVRSEDLRQLLASGADIETWSQLLIPHLDELLPARLAVVS
jgi:predicted NUDIX family phosphoesterase